MAGIKESKEVVELGLKLAKAVVASIEEKSIDILGLAKAAMLLKPAIDGISEVPEELKDLDAAEIEELGKVVIAELPGVSEKHLEIASQAVKAVVELVKLVKVIKG